jgi:tetratricopeptide (TPR) repeat protein
MTTEKLGEPVPETLESIRNEAIGGGYQRALERLDAMLIEKPDAVEALRLKGNILELRALDGAQYHAKKLLALPDFVCARKCYERILELDPHNTLALADLGDHYKNLGAYDKAVSYLVRAAKLLEAGESRLSLREEAEEMIDRIADCGQSEEISYIERVCREVIGRA